MKHLLNPHLFNFYDLSGTEVDTLPPKDYLTINRLDIIPRYIYAKHYLLGYGRKWGEYVYREALQALNPSFTEGDGRKKGFEDYRRQFDALIESYKKSGHDWTNSLIPVAEKSIVDGAHRVATALALGCDIKTIEVTGNPHLYNAQTYQNANLAEPALEAIVREYITLKENFHAVVLFPIGQSKQKRARKVLAENASLFYEKKVTLSEHGKANLLDILYGHENWWVQRNVVNLTRRFDSKSSDVHILFVEFNEGANPLEVKNEIRDFYKLGNDPIHISDYHFEVEWLADAVLNRNGRMHLNNFHPRKFERYENFIKTYQTILQSHDNSENFCIDSGAVLAQFGIRDTQDIDYISADGTTLCDGNNDINIHNDEYKYMPFLLDELVYDPRFHFRYKGVKFLSIETVEWFKKLRAEEKDFKDVDLIRQCVVSQSLFSKRGFLWRKRLQRMAYKLAPAGVKITKKILPEKAYLFIRKYYRKLF